MTTAENVSNTITIQGTLIASGDRRVISIRKSYNKLLDDLPSKRLLLKILALP